MPYDSVNEEAAARYLQGLIALHRQRWAAGQADTAWPSAVGLANRLHAAYETWTDRNIHRARSAAQRAIDAAMLAERMARFPNFRPPADRYPRDHVLGPLDERYRYVVHIYIDDGSTRGIQYTVEYRSDYPMTAAELQNNIEANIGAYVSPRNETRRAVAVAPAGANIVVTPVLAYRR